MISLGPQFNPKKGIGPDYKPHFLMKISETMICTKSYRQLVKELEDIMLTAVTKQY